MITIPKSTIVTVFYNYTTTSTLYIIMYYIQFMMKKNGLKKSPSFLKSPKNPHPEIMPLIWCKNCYKQAVCTLNSRKKKWHKTFFFELCMVLTYLIFYHYNFLLSLKFYYVSRYFLFKSQSSSNKCFKFLWGKKDIKILLH